MTENKIPPIPVGLPRARQLVDGIENSSAAQLQLPPAAQIAMKHAQAAQAQAIATISLAESARLEALLLLDRAAHETQLLNSDELVSLSRQIRLLAGFEPIRENIRP